MPKQELLMKYKLNAFSDVASSVWYVIMCHVMS